MGDEVLEELGPCQAGPPGSSEYVLQLIDAVARQGKDCLVGVGVDRDDRAVGEVVVAGDDSREKFWIFSESPGDVVDGEDLGDRRD